MKVNKLTWVLCNRLCPYKAKQTDEPRNVRRNESCIKVLLPATQ